MVLAKKRFCLPESGFCMCCRHGCSPKTCGLLALVDDIVMNGKENCEEPCGSSQSWPTQVCITAIMNQLDALRYNRGVRIVNLGRERSNCAIVVALSWTSCKTKYRDSIPMVKCCQYLAGRSKEEIEI